MGAIYTNSQGKQVYDYNGQTYDAKTGQPVGSAPTSAPSTQSIIPTTSSAPPAPAAASAPSSSFPTAALQPGATGPQVQALQDWLVQNNYMTKAQVSTGYGTYGPQTTAAVQQLQKDLGVDNSSGPGYFGPKTIAAVSDAVSKQSSSGDSSSTDPVTFTPTGNDNLDKVLSSLAGVGNSIISSGYTIPTTLQITPDIVSKFLGWAHQVVDPQTQQLITAESANINASLSNAAQQYAASQGQIVQDFGTGLATEQNTAGGNGTAFSGQRNINENNMAASTNRSLASLDASTALGIGNTLRAGAADVGTANAGAFSLPTLNSSSVSLAGGQRGSSTTGNSLDFGYDPSIYTAGNIPTAQNTALNDLQANYLGQYGTLAGSNSNGSRSVSDLFGMMSGLPAGASLT